MDWKTKKKRNARNLKRFTEQFDQFLPGCGDYNKCLLICEETDCMHFCGFLV